MEPDLITKEGAKPVQASDTGFAHPGGCPSWLPLVLIGTAIIYPALAWAIFF